MGAYDIQYESDGRPYTWIGGQVGGKKSYISPVAMGTGTRPDDNTGIFRKGPQWNASSGKWETPIDWGNILNVGVAGGLGAGALSAAGLFGGAAAPGSSAAASSTAGTGATAGVGAGTGAGVGLGETAAVTGIPASTAASLPGFAAIPSAEGLAAGGGGALASTPIGNGMAATPAGGSGMASGGGTSALSRVAGVGKKLSDVLGGASKSQADSRHTAAQDQLDWERLNLAAPGSKLSTMLAAALTKNFTPRTLNWGGPGSGLKGETPSYSGGSNAAMRLSLQDPMVQKLLADVEAGKAGIPNPTAAGQPGHESRWDKILGGAAFGTSILGAL